MSKFSERVKLAEDYHKWRKSQKGFEVKDCAESVIAYVEPILCSKKDHRIAELEKENEEKEDKILDLKSYNSDLKETISKLSFSAVRCQAINDEVCQYILDNELLKKENAELKAKLEKMEEVKGEER